jgi:hypothetical protein
MGHNAKIAKCIYFIYVRASYFESDVAAYFSVTHNILHASARPTMYLAVV